MPFVRYVLIAVWFVYANACSAPLPPSVEPVQGIITVVIPEEKREPEVMAALEETLRRHNRNFSLERVDNRSELSELRRLSLDWIRNGKRLPCLARLYIYSPTRLDRFDILDPGRTPEPQDVTPDTGTGVWLVAMKPGSAKENPAPPSRRLAFNEQPYGGGYYYEVTITPGNADTVTHLILNKAQPRLQIRTYSGERQSTAAAIVRWLDTDDAGRLKVDPFEEQHNQGDNTLYAAPDLERFVVLRMSNMGRSAYGEAYVDVTRADLRPGHPRVIEADGQRITKSVSFEDLRLANFFFADVNVIPEEVVKVRVRYRTPARETSDAQPIAYVQYPRDDDPKVNIIGEFKFQRIEGSQSEWEVVKQAIDVAVPASFYEGDREIFVRVLLRNGGVETRRDFTTKIDI